MGRNSNLERNRNFLGRQNDTFFDKEEYKSEILGVLTEKIGQKEDNKGQLRNSLHKDKPLPDSKQRLILEIIGEEEFDIDNIKITKEKLERINENKALILEITGEEKITIYDLVSHGKELSEITKEGLERINKNKELIQDITIGEKIDIMDLKKLSEISEEGRKNMNENIELIQDIIVDFSNEVVFATNLKGLSEITKEELERINKNKESIQDIIGEKIHIMNLKNLSKIPEEGRKIIQIIKQNIGTPIPLFSNIGIVGLFDSEYGDHKGYWEYLSKLDEETIDYCKIHDIKGLRMIVMVDKIMKNSGKIRDYVKRKQEYLKNNRLLNDSEFEKLFGGTGKYGKGEINQTGLGYCYLYTAYEILKKMNFFEALVKTNLKKNESGDGWYVKLPMGQPDGQWISVSKN